MGTNFYWKVTTAVGIDVNDTLDSDDPAIHIGKRSAAGYYCWDCRLTLCRDGEERIHEGSSEWHKTCPKCGRAPIKEGLDAGAVAVELGFAKPRTEGPTGVRDSSSFTWAQDPDRVLTLCREHRDEAVIRDEYGRDLTGTEFLHMLRANCPIQYTRSVGRMFS